VITVPPIVRNVMKRILFAVLALAVCVGCSGSKTSNSQPQSQQPPPPPVGNGLVGIYGGSVTGTNFVGTVPFSMDICYENSSDSCEASAGTLMIEDGTIFMNCNGNSGAGVLNTPITVNGNQFSASGSGNDSQLGNWTFSMSGTMSNTTGVPVLGQTISGNVTFSTGVCGSPANPWAGTFSAKLTTL
jgi:hypothetical protein